MSLKVIERRPYSEYGLQSEIAQNDAAFSKLIEIQSGGNTKHSVWSNKDAWSHGVHFEHAPVVGLANDDDPYYCQYFTNREQLDAFIAKLKTAADEAWGEA